MMIRKPIGAILQYHQLPNKSYVNVEVVENSDGIRDVILTHSHDMGCSLYITISDFLFIAEWAQQP